MPVQIKQVENLRAELDNRPSLGRLNSAGPIQQVVVQQVTDTIDIVGLDLATDGELLMMVDTQSVDAGVTQYKIYAGDPTLDTTDVNYDTSRQEAGVHQTFNAPVFGGTDSSADTVNVVMTLTQDLDGRFLVSVTGNKNTNPFSYLSAIRSVNTFGPITNIRLLATQANGFPAGTTVRVYRYGGTLPTGTSLTPLDVKRAADAFDDEFESDILDPSWTAVTGSSGTVNFTGNGAPGGGNGVYDLSTRGGWLLLQGDNTEHVELRKDYTLAAGESIVACVAASGRNDGGTAGEIGFGIAINDSDAGYDAGNGLSFYASDADGGPGGLNVQVTGTGTYSTALEDSNFSPTGRKLYLRIVRTASNYEFHYSTDGTSWSYLASEAVGNVANNVWIFNHPAAATSAANPPVMGVDWIRLGTDELDPWPLVDGSSVAPVYTGEFRGALVNLATSQTGATSSTNVAWDTVVEDTDGSWSVANPSRLTVPSGVTRVRVSAGVRFDNVTGTEIRAEIFKNGVRFVGGAQQEHSNSPAGVQAITLNTQAVAVTAGDYFELQITMTGGTTFDVDGSDVTWFGLEVVEPVVAITDEGSVNVTSAGSPYTVPDNKRVIYCDTTLGAIELDLPALTNNDGQVYEVKIIAGSNSVTLDPSGAETIEGSSTYVFSGVNEARTFRAKSLNGNLGWYLLSSTELGTADDTALLIGTTYTCTATEAVGDLVYISGADTVAQASASALATARVIGRIVAKPTSTSCVVSTAPGPVPASGLTVGAPVYLSDTAGAVSSTEGTVIVEVGIADTTTSFVFTGYKIVG